MEFRYYCRSVGEAWVMTDDGLERLYKDKVDIPNVPATPGALTDGCFGVGPSKITDLLIYALQA